MYQQWLIDFWGIESFHDDESDDDTNSLLPIYCIPPYRLSTMTRVLKEEQIRKREEGRLINPEMFPRLRQAIKKKGLF